MRRSRWAMPAVGVSAVLLAGCGSSQQSGVSHEVVSAGDPSYALIQLRSASTGDEIQPANLRKSLPNFQRRVPDAAHLRPRRHSFEGNLDTPEALIVAAGAPATTEQVARP